MVNRNRFVQFIKKAGAVFLMTLTLSLGFHSPVFAACGDYSGGRNLLTIPPWYKYLEDDTATGGVTGRCVPKVDSVDDSIPIVLAVIEIMLRVATYIAIIMFIYGAIRMIISQGSPDEVKKSRDTVVNSVVGLVIALIATAVVNFVGRAVG